MASLFPCSLFLALCSLATSQFAPNVWIPFYLSQTAICEEQMMCNGDMCVETCKPGTVQVDEYASYSLAYQRYIQLNASFLTYQFPGTHNSHISVAYGFGIEYHYLSALNNGKILSFAESSDLHLQEGTDQYLSIIDQLNMGIRHIEIDINWGPLVTFNLSSHIVVCHTPIIDPIVPSTISIWADQRDVSLNYDPLRLSCQKTHIPFVSAMSAIKDWLDTNPNEFIIIYYDTKWPIDTSQAQWGINTLMDIFGKEMMVTPNDTINGVLPSMNDLLQNGKHILFETEAKGWVEPSNSFLFYPALWNTPNHLQFSPNQFLPFPNCSINGILSYGKQISRDLGDVVVEESKLNRQYHKIIQSVTKCGVNIASPHMINPMEMHKFVWSFAYGEPNKNYECVAQKPNGYWATKDCSTKMNVACVDDEDGTKWMVTNEQFTWNEAKDKADNICKAKFVFGVPTDGYQNSLLNVESLAKYVWINTNTKELDAYRATHDMKSYRK